MKVSSAIIQTPSLRQPHRHRHRKAGRGRGRRALESVKPKAKSRAALPLKVKPLEDRVLAELRASAAVMKLHGLWEKNPFPPAPWQCNPRHTMDLLFASSTVTHSLWSHRTNLSRVRAQD